jgi:CMP/dCMP kinase
MKRLTVAIDGPAGAGKSTAARLVAQQLGYVYIDSGAMYRAVALRALRAGIDAGDTGALGRLAEATQIEFRPGIGKVRVCVDGEDVSHDIRTPEVTALSSEVSVVPAVRAAMVRQQQQMGAHGGVVMEGRDIGTVVFPYADVKIYLDASPEERARRRAADPAHASSKTSQLADVATALAERDKSDSTRAISPLAIAPDATVVDTTGIGVDEVIDRVLKIIATR